MLNRLLLLCAFSSVICQVCAADDLLIELPDGKIRGHQITSTSENITLNAWQGIPFATPPLGKLRFQAPVSPKQWSGVKNTNQCGNTCLTLIHYRLDPDLGNQSEDCLYLNVYAPAKKVNKKLPVMFWIYGGGFVSGSSNYDFFGPDYIVNEDVIVVDFNYRLGFLGFLSTGDKVVLGNAGLKDQLLALQWTKQNIHLFGGDPEQITIFGESAGGASVGIHIWNKKSAGLFRAAICESGCSLGGILLDDTQKPATYALAKEIDPRISEQNTTEEVVDFLQSVSADELIQANQKCALQTGVTVEQDDENAFITLKDAVKLRTLFESGEINRVPLIIGTNQDEGISFAGTYATMLYLASGYDNNLTTLVPVALLNAKPGTNLTEVGELIKNTYVGENGTFRNNIVQFLEFTTDKTFGRASLKQAQIQSKYAAVYMYRFTYYGTVSKLRGYEAIPELIEAGRVGHADELPYLFKISTFDLKTEEDFLARKRLVKMWTNFAKTMNPTPDPEDPLLNVTWAPVSPENIQYLNINETLEMKPNRKVKEFAMWNYMYDTYGTPPFRGF